VRKKRRENLEYITTLMKTVLLLYECS